MSLWFITFSICMIFQKRNGHRFPDTPTQNTKFLVDRISQKRIRFNCLSLILVRQSTRKQTTIARSVRNKILLSAPVTSATRIKSLRLDLCRCQLKCRLTVWKLEFIIIYVALSLEVVTDHIFQNSKTCCFRWIRGITENSQQRKLEGFGTQGIGCWYLCLSFLLIVIKK